MLLEEEEQEKEIIVRISRHGINTIELSYNDRTILLIHENGSISPIYTGSLVDGIEIDKEGYVRINGYTRDNTPDIITTIEKE